MFARGLPGANHSALDGPGCRNTIPSGPGVPFLGFNRDDLGGVGSQYLEMKGRASSTSLAIGAGDARLSGFKKLTTNIIGRNLGLKSSPTLRFLLNFSKNVYFLAKINFFTFSFLLEAWLTV